MQEAHSSSEGEEVLAPDEPPTPLWLPLLGAALFLLAIIAFAATRDGSGPTSASSTAAESASAQAPAAPVKAAQ
ncbi:MAG TPA: hypothetical protein VL137_16005 [Polyangiaceae bacterium]|nr:hypothetical protein [Polyangiaceae bacterium]